MAIPVSIKTPAGKTVSGSVEVAAGAIRFAPQSADDVPIEIPFADVRTQLKNKDGAEKTILKVKLRSSDNAYQLIFTAEKPKAVADRQTVIDAVAAYIAASTSASVSVSVSGSTQSLADTKGGPLGVSISSTGSVSSSINGSGTNSPMPPMTPSISVGVDAEGSTQSPAQSVRSDSRPVYNKHKLVEHKEVKYDDFTVKQELLKNDKLLASVFKDIVLSGFISEKEFWESRRHLLVRQAWEINQRQGPSTQLLDLRGSADDQMKFRFTPEVIDAILEQYGAVRRAYEANVLTGKMSTKNFWEKFLKSKYFRKIPGVLTRDHFFAKYEQLEQDEAEIHPENVHYKGSSWLLDLEALEEDHGETGNEADVPMRAGKVKEALPVIRQYNMNSDRVIRDFKKLKTESKNKSQNSEDIMIIDDDDNSNEENVRRKTKGSTNGADVGIGNRMSDSDEIFLDETVIPDLNVREEVHTFPLIISNHSGYIQGVGIDKKADEIRKLEKVHAKDFIISISRREFELYKFDIDDQECDVVEKKLIDDIDGRRPSPKETETSSVIQAKKLFTSTKELLHHYYVLVNSKTIEKAEQDSKRARVIEALREASTKLETMKTNYKADESVLMVVNSIIPALTKVLSQ